MNYRQTTKLWRIPIDRALVGWLFKGTSTQKGQLICAVDSIGGCTVKTQSVMSVRMLSGAIIIILFVSVPLKI